jgi:hypothetical protein
MTEQTQNQDVELENDNEVVEEAHDPKNAEKQSVDSVNKADDAGPKAPARKGDKKNSEPMPKSKAGMIKAAYDKMSGLSKQEMSELMGRLFAEGSEEAGDVIDETPNRDHGIEVNFEEDLNAIMESEATLSDEFKAKTAVIFEAAVKDKLSSEIDRLEESYKQELDEEIKSTRSNLVEKVDSYLNYVVDTWMEENKLAVQAGLRTEIAEDFMNKLKDLFTESYVEVPESKVDLVDELTSQNSELETQLNDAMKQAINVSEELEGYKREAVIREMSKDLAETQVEKLKSLAENVDFDNEESFTKKIATLKESYFNKKTVESNIEVDEDEAADVESSPIMERYLKAIRKASK